MNIRSVNLDDAAQIAEIYNYYIQNTHHTFETEPLDVEEMRRRISEVIEDYPYFVTEENGQILGYIYAAQFKLRQAYAHSVEVSIYVRNEERQTGIGKSLYMKFLDELAETNIHAIVAGIALPNDASVKFHERLGFEKVARFREIGYKLGRWIDVGYWELLNRI